MIDENAEVLAVALGRLLSQLQVREQSLRQIQRQVRSPRRHEERVVEGFCRCLITEHLRSIFRLKKEDLPMLINSSHSSVRQACVMPGEHDHASAYSVNSWKEFRRANPDVDFYETPSTKKGLRRADLFVVVRHGKLLSFEFKHVASTQVPNVKESVKQMLRYKKHGASILVIYAAEPVSSGFVQNAGEIRRRLPRRMSVIMIQGPAIMLY